MRWNQLCALARSLPEVTEGSWYGTPALLVRGQGFVRQRDSATVVFLTANLDEQDALIATLPAVYFITDHYVGHPAVLARLAKLSPGQARIRLEGAWRHKAPPALVQQLADPVAMKRSKVTTRYLGPPRKPAK